MSCIVSDIHYSTEGLPNAPGNSTRKMATIQQGRIEYNVYVVSNNICKVCFLRVVVGTYIFKVFIFSFLCSGKYKIHLNTLYSLLLAPNRPDNREMEQIAVSHTPYFLSLLAESGLSGLVSYTEAQFCFFSGGQKKYIDFYL